MMKLPLPSLKAAACGLLIGSLLGLQPALAAPAELTAAIRNLGWAPSGAELALVDTLPRPPVLSAAQTRQPCTPSAAAFADDAAQSAWARRRPARVLTIWGLAHYGARAATGDGKLQCQDLAFLAGQWQAALGRPASGHLDGFEVSELARAISDIEWGRTPAFAGLAVGVAPGAAAQALPARPAVAMQAPAPGPQPTVPTPTQTAAPATPDLPAPTPLTHALPRPLYIVVPFAGGGFTDAFANVLAEAMQRHTTQSVTVVNQPGAGQILGMARFFRDVEVTGGTFPRWSRSKRTSDGDVVLFSDSSISILDTVYRSKTDSAEFDLLGLVATQPLLFMAGLTFATGDIPKLRNQIRQQQKQTSIGYVGGVGSISHRCALLFANVINGDVEIRPVTFAPERDRQLIDGSLDLSCDTPLSFQSKYSPEVKAVYVSGQKRLSSYPALQTAKEAGFPQLEMTQWYGLFVPKDSPAGATEAIAAVFRAALQDKELVTKYVEWGLIPATAEQASPSWKRAFRQAESERWIPLLRKAGQYRD